MKRFSEALFIVALLMALLNYLTPVNKYPDIGIDCDGPLRALIKLAVVFIFIATGFAVVFYRKNFKLSQNKFIYFVLLLTVFLTLAKAPEINRENELNFLNCPNDR